ncbi:MAG TPA: potassium channel protein [Campylobacterales bacterium]|nr:potassium channel protein [Campylobacterales bacterium]
MASQNRIKKFLGWRETVKPHITLNDELYVLLAPFRLPLILTVLTMLIGTLGYIVIEGMNFSDALFQTGITFTTVGFGEIQPLSQIGRIFTISLIIFGFIIFSAAIGIIVEVLNRGELQKVIKERRMLYEIARLKQHYVICYHNEFTIQVTKYLRESHIPFVVIDPSDEIAEIATKYQYPYYVKGEPHTQEAILKSHLSSAKGIITLADSIADNIATIASVRLYEQEIGRMRSYLIISNAHSVSDEEKLKKLGADKVVTPTNIMAQRINAMAIRPDMENLLQEFLYRQDTPLDMEEAHVRKTSWLTLRKVRDAKFREIANVTIIGLRYKDGRFVAMPKGDTTITEGSKLLLIGPSEGIQKAKKIIRKSIQPEEMKHV